MDVVAWVMAVLLVRPDVLPAVVLLIVVVSLYATAGLYRERLTLSALDDLRHLFNRAVAGGAVVTSVFLLSDGSALHARRLVLATVLWALVTSLARSVAYERIRMLRRRGWRSASTLVIGAGSVGGHITRILQDHPEYGLRPVGFVDDRPRLTADDLPAPLLGDQVDLVDVIRSYDIRNVVIAFSHAPESTMIDAVRQCDRMECEVFVVPRLFELSHQSDHSDHAWGFPLTRLPRPAFRSPLWQVKRMVDVLVAGLALLLVWPIMAVCALLIRRETGAEVLFRQCRVGLDGAEFELLKFQTLRPEATAADESATRWSIADDLRVGPVGRFLRRTSLDELPQLWNIMRGDMTLVGPRPERPYFVQEFSTMLPRYMARHRVPAGLTGWAQIHDLRGDTSIEDRIRFDNFYIEHWSLWGDVKILLRTVPSVLRGSGG